MTSKVKVHLEPFDFEAHDIFESKSCREKYDISYQKIPDPDAIPVGDLDYSTTHLELDPPNHYPDFLQKYVKREIVKSTGMPIMSEYIGWYIKPADTAKRFPSRQVGWDLVNYNLGAVYLSEPLDLVESSEVRHYVTRDKIVLVEENLEYGKKYQKIIQDLLDTVQPGFYGTIDMAMSDDLGPVLVECDYPIATGFYGTRSEIDKYLDWLVEGYKYLSRSETK